LNRSLLLDLLRIAAITLVFIAHFGQLLGGSTGGFFGVKNFYYVSLGGVGVTMFLVLSGILAGLVDATRTSGYLSYMVKKLLRIYPLYWLSIPLSMLGFVLGEWYIDGEIPNLFPNGLVTDLIFSLSGFYSWIGLWGGPYNAPSWFIALIMVMYALFPPLVWLLKKWPHWTLLALLLISAGSRYYVGQEGIPFVDQSVYGNIKGWFFRQYGFMPGRPGDWFPPCRVFEFGLGIYLALIVPKSFWFKLRLDIMTRPVNYLSDLAFPLFLLHYPFMFLVLALKNNGVPLGFAITIYMAGLLPLSHWVASLDKRIPRKKLSRPGKSG
jgi:peptidoglycan/LPS O-acetylase OafA/YrhL